MARFTFQTRLKSGAQEQKEAGLRGRGAAPQLDLAKLRAELQKARCRVGVLNDGEPPMLYPAPHSHSERRRSKSCSDPPVCDIAELPGCVPEGQQFNHRGAPPVVARHSTDMVAVPKRRSSRPLSDKYGLPSGVRVKRSNRAPSTIMEKALPETPNDAEGNGQLTQEDSAELLALEKQFGLSERGKKPSHEERLKRISKLQSVLGVPIPQIPASLDSGYQEPLRRARGRKESPRKQAPLDCEPRQRSADDQNDFARAMKKKKDRHLDLMEVNRALRDACNMQQLRDQIEDLQKDLAERNAVIHRYNTLDSLQSRYSTTTSQASHARNYSSDSEYGSTAPTQESRSSMERGSSDVESPVSYSPATPPNDTPHTAADRQFAQSELHRWWTYNSSHEGEEYHTFLADDILAEDFPPELVPKKHDAVELEAPVPVPSAVMKVVDINEQWADIECIESPAALSEPVSPDDAAPLPPLKSARRVSSQAFADLPAPQKALYEAIEEHLRRNSQCIPETNDAYEVESPEMYPEFYAELRGDDEPQGPPQDAEPPALQPAMEEADAENKIGMSALPFANGPLSPASPTPAQPVEGLGILF